MKEGQSLLRMNVEVEHPWLSRCNMLNRLSSDIFSFYMKLFNDPRLKFSPILTFLESLKGWLSCPSRIGIAWSMPGRSWSLVAGPYEPAWPKIRLMRGGRLRRWLGSIRT